jgi:hypothetical protein
MLNIQLQNSDSDKQKKEIEEKIQYWRVELNNIQEEKNRNKTLFRKRLIDEEELDGEIARLTSLENKANSEIKRLESLISDYYSSEGLTYDLMQKYYWDADFEKKKSLVNEYLQKVVTYRVDQTDFDITEHNGTAYINNEKERKIRIVRTDNFPKPVVNGVIYYVEIYTYLKQEPIKAVISSARGINFSPKGLKYDENTKKYSSGESPLVYNIETRTVFLDSSKLELAEE